MSGQEPDSIHVSPNEGDIPPAVVDLAAEFAARVGVCPERAAEVLHDVLREQGLVVRPDPDAPDIRQG